jgi:hypothetical protein
MTNLNYSQSTGNLTDDNGKHICTGFAGNDSRPGVNPNHIHGFDNPDAESIHGIGPLPKGKYTVGTWGDHPPLGPMSAPLTQIEGETYGRSGFFIHGGAALDVFNSSEGCVVLHRDDRETVMNMKPDTITVTA